MSHSHNIDRTSPLVTLYPLHSKWTGEKLTPSNIAARFPEYPIRSKQSIAASMLAGIISEYGSRSKRGTVSYACRMLRKYIGNTDASYETALIFTKNIPGSRIPKPLSEQYTAFRRLLFTVWNVALREANKATQDPASKESHTPDEKLDIQTDSSRCSRCNKLRSAKELRNYPNEPLCYPCKKGPRDMTPAERLNETPSEVKTPDAIKVAESHNLILTVNDPESYAVWSKDKVRPLCDKHNADGHKLDDWSMRSTIDGVKAILAGAPVMAVMDSVTMHFPDEARYTLGVERFDFTEFGINKYLQILASAGVPALMIGPKGTGKTTHARKLAESLGVDFAAVSMTLGTPPSAFYGRPKVGGDGGVVESRFVKIFRDGGVYLFDELDAGDPNLLLIVNAALADGGFFENPSTGELVERSSGFVPVGAANTIGLGGGRDYTGRERLDAATLDRWSAGRVRVTLDGALEDSLVSTLISESE